MKHQTPNINNQERIKYQTSIINPRIGAWKLVFGFFLMFVFWFLYLAVGSVALTGEEIIKKVDANMTFASSSMESKMIIKVGEQERTKKMVSFSEGRNKSFAEFTYPARDRGVKYLKIDDNMWMYLPSVEKIIKIAGHMLRQSMMGSDFSYEDVLESNNLLDKYNVGLVGSTETAHILELIAKVKEVTYYQRKIWVDKKTFVPTREEMFAKSGKKLKVMILSDVKKFGKRYYPTKITLQNLLRRNSKTSMMVEKATFDIRLPEGIFTQRNLKQ